ncbi:MAG: 1-phosphofructokinase [Anaerolineae bacterium]
MIYTVTLNPSIDRTLHLRGLRVGELNRADSAAIDLAGKGVNVSVALRALGLESVLLGFAGGATGRYLVDGLRERGYTCAFQQVRGETRSNLTVVDDASGQVTKLNEPGPMVSPTDLDALMATIERIGDGDVCVLSGSLPPGAPSDTYARLISTLRSQGAHVALDASGAALAEGLMARPDLIKPNLAEARDLLDVSLNGPQAWAEAVHALRERGARHVVLSLGKQGAVSDEGGSTLWARPPVIEEASPVGAGDALLAGWLYARERGLDETERLRWAVACGTAAAGLDGSRMPCQEAVEEMRLQVEVQLIRAA